MLHATQNDTESNLIWHSSRNLFFKTMVSSLSWRWHWPGLGECFWTTPDIIPLVGHFPSLYPQSGSWNTKLALCPVPDWNFPGALLFPGSNLIDAEIWTGHAFWFWRILKLQAAFLQIEQLARTERPGSITEESLFEKAPTTKCYFDSCWRHKQIKRTYSNTLNFIFF